MFMITTGSRALCRGIGSKTKNTDKLSILMSPNCSKQRSHKEKCVELLSHNCNTRTLPHFEPPPLGDPGGGELFLSLKPLFKVAKSCSIPWGKKLFDMSTSFSIRCSQ